MKNKIFFIALSCFLILFDLCAQNAQKNLEKYWNYRQRLNQYFTMVGPGPGQSMIADARNSYQGMRFGEDAVFKGYYIGMLATEYAILHFNHQTDAENYTLTELYYAIESFEKLDQLAEKVYNLVVVPNGPKNGICLRDDVDKKIFEDISGSYYDHFNKGISGTSLSSPSITPGKIAEDKFVGASTYSAVLYGDDNHPQPGVPNSKGQDLWSQDLISQYFIGLALVKRYVPIGVQPFENKITLSKDSYDFHAKVDNLLDRLMKYMIVSNWILKQPNGIPISPNEGGLAKPTSPGFCFAAKKINPNINWELHINNPTATLPWWKTSYNHVHSGGILYSSHGIYCALAAIGDSWKTLSKTTDEILKQVGNQTWGGFSNGGAEFYRLLHQDLYNKSADVQVLCNTVSILNSAPEFGPWAHGPKDFFPGWATSRRFYNYPDAAFQGKPGFYGNYNGLDYMLLHNLLYLNYSILNNQGPITVSGLYPHKSVIFAGSQIEGHTGDPQIFRTNKYIVLNNAVIGTLDFGAIKYTGHVEAHGEKGVLVTNAHVLPNSGATLIIDANGGGCDVDVSAFKWPGSYNPSYR